MLNRIHGLRRRAGLLAIEAGIRDLLTPHDALVVLGDSIAARMPDAFPRTMNLAVSGWSTRDLAAAIPKFTRLHRARAFLVSVGVNDLLKGEEPDYAPILAQLPQRPVLWSGIVPTKRIPAHAIKAANDKLRALPGVYVDVSSIDDFEPDGVHLSERGYQHWVTLLMQSYRRLSSR